MTRLHLVDGTFELFRAHFSPRPGQRDASGRDVKATVGLAASLLQLLEDREEAVSHIAVAFDNPVESFRNDLFDGYKTGEGMPEELAAQFDAAERATAALGATVWSMDRYEADDALASGAARFRDEVEQVRLMTPDKDLGQSIRGTRVVQIDRMRKKLTDEQKLRDLRGVGPASIPDWLGLMGDSADGIPGIPGFGAKSAAAVLAHYERIENIPEMRRIGRSRCAAPNGWRQTSPSGAKRRCSTNASPRSPKTRRSAGAWRNSSGKACHGGRSRISAPK